MGLLPGKIQCDGFTSICMCFLPFCCRALTGLLFVGALLSLVDLVEAAPFTPVQSRVEVIVANGFDPVPTDVGLVADAEGFDFTAMKAVSDRAWVVPTVQGVQGGAEGTGWQVAGWRGAGKEGREKGKREREERKGERVSCEVK